MNQDSEQIRALLLDFIQLRRVACYAERHAPAEYLRPERAVTYAQIATGTQQACRLVCVDVDDNPHGPFCADEAGLPPPHFAVCRPDNPRSVHLIYCLSYPVHRESRDWTLLRDVRSALAQAVPGGDQSYCGARVRSPCSPDWISYLDARAPADGYGLAELADQLDLPGKIEKAKVELVVGRNVTLFNHLRRAAGGMAHGCGLEIQLRRELEQEGQRVNLSFEEPLPVKEVASVAKSVAAYAWKYHIEVARPAFLKKQAARGKRSGSTRAAAADEKATKVLELRAIGMTWAQVAAETVIPVGTCRDLASKRGC